MCLKRAKSFCASWKETVNSRLTCIDNHNLFNLFLLLYPNFYSEYGISRSATMVLAYLMKKRKMTYYEALDLVKERKHDIR